MVQGSRPMWAVFLCPDLSASHYPHAPSMRGAVNSLLASHTDATKAAVPGRVETEKPTFHPLAVRPASASGMTWSNASGDICPVKGLS
jgi:hypothetical protein